MSSLSWRLPFMPTLAIAVPWLWPCFFVDLNCHLCDNKRQHANGVRDFAQTAADAKAQHGIRPFVFTISRPV